MALLHFQSHCLLPLLVLLQEYITMHGPLDVKCIVALHSFQGSQLCLSEKCWPNMTHGREKLGWKLRDDERNVREWGQAMCVTEHLLHSWQGRHRTRQAVHKEAAGRERIREKQTRALWETGLAWGWMTRGMISSPLHTSLNREAVCTKHNNPSAHCVPPTPLPISVVRRV